MSGTFPSSPAASAFDWTLNTPSYYSQAVNLNEQTRSRGGARFMGTLTWGPQTKASMAPIYAFLAAQRGQYNKFQIVLPPPFDVPQGSWAGGAPQVDGAVQTGRTVNLKNFTPSQSGVVKAGDVFKFSDSKIYMATADANSTGAGKVAALAIEPALIVSPADAEAITYTAVPFTMRAASDLLAFSLRPPILFTFALALQEAYP